MKIPNELISQFVSMTNDTKKTKKESMLYGTVSEVNSDGSRSIKIDGSDLLTPVSSTTTLQVGDRVAVMVKNHGAVVLGNITSPAPRKDDVDKGLEAAGVATNYINYTDGVGLVVGAKDENGTVGSNVLISSDGVSIRKKDEIVAEFGTSYYIAQNGEVGLDGEIVDEPVNDGKAWEVTTIYSNSKNPDSRYVFFPNGMVVGRTTLSRTGINANNPIILNSTIKDKYGLEVFNPLFNTRQLTDGTWRYDLRIGYGRMNGETRTNANGDYTIGKGTTHIYGENIVLNSANNVLIVAPGTTGIGANTSYDDLYCSKDETRRFIRSRTIAKCTSTSASNVYIDSDGILCKSSSSSRRYKKDIVDLPLEHVKGLYDVPVRQFKYKDEYISESDERYGKDMPGFIAEEIAECLPIACDHRAGTDGNIVPEMWNEKIIVPSLLKLIQDLNNRLKAIEEGSIQNA